MSKHLLLTNELKSDTDRNKIKITPFSWEVQLLLSDEKKKIFSEKPNASRLTGSDEHRTLLRKTRQFNLLIGLMITFSSKHQMCRIVTQNICNARNFSSNSIKVMWNINREKEIWACARKMFVRSDFLSNLFLG